MDLAGTTEMGDAEEASWRRYSSLATKGLNFKKNRTLTLSSEINESLQFISIQKATARKYRIKLNIFDVKVHYLCTFIHLSGGNDKNKLTY